MTSKTHAPRAPSPLDLDQPGPQQGERGSSSLKGLTYAQGVEALSPPGGAVQAKTLDEDPNKAVSSSDVPGVLFSNTSKTNLNKKADWVARLGFQLGTHYEGEFTFDDLVRAGSKITAPQAAGGGRVQVPSGANTRDPLEYDYIGTPGGTVKEVGQASFALRGGEGGVGGPAKLSFANNGALNLARLARAAYELVIAKGGGMRSDGSVNYAGQTYALGCTVRMGNDIDADKARSYSFMGEFDLKWMQEKVSTTIEALVTSVAVAAGRVMHTDRRPDSQALIHPYYRSAAGYQTPRHEKTPGGVSSRKAGVLPIDSENFNHATVKSWGLGADQKAWLSDPGEIAAAAQQRLSGSWAPGGDWRGHPTYIQACPDFTGLLTATYAECTGTYVKPKDMAAHILEAMVQIGAELQLAPMEHELITDPALQERIVTANRATMKAAFAEVTQTMILERIEELKFPMAPPVHKPMDEPVEGVAPNNEGLVVLRDWSSRGG